MKTEVIQFNLAESSTNDLKTCTIRFEIRKEDEVHYALAHAYDRCNYYSSFEEVAILADMTVDEVKKHFETFDAFIVSEVTNTNTWSVRTYQEWL